MELASHIKNRINLLGGSVNSYIEESTRTIFDLIYKPDDELKPVSVKDLNLGKFFMIKYSYGGNQIWCPLFTLEYKVNKNKNILYAINLDYLPYNFKMEFFNVIFKNFKSYVEYNKDIKNVKAERRFKEIKFETIYNILKESNGFNFAITAYDILKMTDIYAVSTNLAHRFLMIDTTKVNAGDMKKLHDRLEFKKHKDQMAAILEGYKELLENYSKDSVEYYKRLRSFEAKYDLLK